MENSIVRTYKIIIFDCERYSIAIVYELVRDLTHLIFYSVRIYKIIQNDNLFILKIYLFKIESQKPVANQMLTYWFYNQFLFIQKFMGQQTQKVSIEQFQEKPQNNKKKIFKNSFKSTGYYRQEECPLPSNCKDSNLKVCKDCQGDGKYPNFRKRSPPKYQPQSNKLRLPRQTGFGENKYHPLKILTEQVPISYYNAWSLPVQPCYIQKITDSRAQTTDEDYGEPKHHVVPVRPDIKHPKPPIFNLDQEKQQESIIHHPPSFDDVDDRGRKQRFFMH